MRIPVALALGAAFVCSSASAFETAFWVWQRSEPLSEAERAELSAQGVRTIYWQTGELENAGETWRWKARFALPSSGSGGLRFVPVVRLDSRERSPFSPASLEALCGALSTVTKGAEEKYPRSHKREAAFFVIARSVQALSRPFVCNVAVDVPGSAPDDQNYDMVQKSYQREAFDPKRVLGALDDYDREFPHGRYAAENRNLRAMTLWRMHDWRQALDLTLAQLNDKSKPDLQPEAALRLANIFADLAQAEYRADLIAAIRSRPPALLRLKAFLEKGPNDRSHPLRYLASFLNDQLKLKGVASN